MDQWWKQNPTPAMRFRGPVCKSGKMYKATKKSKKMQQTKSPFWRAENRGGKKRVEGRDRERNRPSKHKQRPSPLPQCYPLKLKQKALKTQPGTHQSRRARFGTCHSKW